MRIGDAYKIRLNETPCVELIPRKGSPIYTLRLSEARKLAHAILAIKSRELPYVCAECGYIYDEEGRCEC